VAARSAFRVICVGTHEFTTLPVQKGGTAHPTTEPKNHPPLVDRNPALQSSSTIVTHLFTHVTISNLQFASSSPPVNYDCSSVLTRLIISSRVWLFIGIWILTTPQTHQCLVTTFHIIYYPPILTALIMVSRAPVLHFLYPSPMYPLDSLYHIYWAPVNPIKRHEPQARGHSIYNCLTRADKKVPSSQGDYIRSTGVLGSRSASGPLCSEES